MSLFDYHSYYYLKKYINRMKMLLNFKNINKGNVIILFKKKVISIKSSAFYTTDMIHEYRCN